MSVVIASTLLALGRSAEDVLRGHEGFALAAITAGLARLCHQAVVRDPKEDEPAHGLVIGKKTEFVSRCFAKGSRWIVPPGSVGI